MPKFDELQILCETHKPGIVCTVESRLSDDIEDVELTIPSYQALRLDRNRHGGGILVYIHNSLTYNAISKGLGNLEVVLISVSQANSTKVVFVLVFFIVHEVLYMHAWMIFILFWKIWMFLYCPILFL